MGVGPSSWAAWMRARSDLRARWRSWLGLALLTGIVAGFVIAAGAGARRTASAYDRLYATTDGYDLAVVGACATRNAPECPTTRSIDEALTLPSVAAGARASTFLLPVLARTGRSLQPDGEPCFTGAGEVAVIGSADGRFGTEVNRRRFVAGREASARTEVVVSEETARRAGLHVGDQLRIVPVDACTDTPRRSWPAPIRVRVAGIHRSIGEIAPDTGRYVQSVAVTPALHADLLDRLGADNPIGVVRLRRDATRADFAAEARAAGVDVQVVFDQSDLEADVERGLGADVTTLWLLAAFGGAVALVVLGQAAMRQVWAGAGDFAALRAIGHTRRSLAGAGALQGLVVGGAAAAAAAAFVVATSPLLPIGRARRIEPDPGVAVDRLAILGPAALVLLVAVGVALATVRVARADATTARSPRRGSRLDRRLDAARLPPTAACGLRMLRRAGAGVPVAPIRSSVAGVAVALSVLVGAVTFAAGLDHLLATPRLVGWNWDLAALSGFERPEAAERSGSPARAAVRRVRRVRRIPGVERAGLGTVFPVSDVQLLGPRAGDVWVMSFGTGRDAVGPTVIDGRAPARAGEVLLNPVLLDRLGVDIGGTIAVHGSARDGDGGGVGSRPAPDRLVVVGTGVIPTNDRARDAAASLTFAGLRALVPTAAPQTLFVDLAGGADEARVRRTLRQLGFDQLLGGSTAGESESDLVTLDVREADTVPRLVALLMAVLAAGVLAHLVATSVRGRRVELATLRALGFTRAQRRATVAWLAAATSGIAMAIGAPLGVLGGRVAWRAYATRLGVLPEPAVPWLALVAITLATLALAVAVATLVARSAPEAAPTDLRRGE